MGPEGPPTTAACAAQTMCLIASSRPAYSSA
ncbi:hypothetical protein [Lysobacter enzymogenes]